jgi:lipopolysaccharide heptosyltransferase I
MLDGSPRILIIRPTALGDVARTVPALVSLRHHLGDQARIDWLVSDACVDAVRHHPMLDGVVAFPRQRFGQAALHPGVLREVWQWTRTLRQARYDMVFDLQGLFRSGLFTRLTGAPRRVGFANAREGGWFGYHRRHRHHVPISLHTVDRMLALLEHDGIPITHDLRLYTAPEDEHWCDTLLREHDPAAALDDVSCIAPTARWLCKCWPIEGYTQIAKQLLDTGSAGSRLVVLAAPSERGQVQPLLDALPPPQRERVLLPTTTVGQMMALVRRARLLVCNDSAPLHMAVGFDRPIVSLFGPTDPARVGPYRRPDAVLQPPECSPADFRYRRHRDDQTLIARITPDRVWSAIQFQLSR